MTAVLQLEEAARLHRAETRWLDQARDRIRRAAAEHAADQQDVAALDPQEPAR